MTKENQYRLGLLPAASVRDSGAAHEWARREVSRAGIRSSRGALAEVLIGRDQTSKHSICELLSYAEYIWSEVLPNSAFASFDVNEALGRVEVGLTSPDAVRRLSEVLNTKGIPESAFCVFVARAPQETSMSWNAYFRHRPVAGGIILGPKGCTLGIVGFSPNGEATMFTNAHCSQQQGVIDGGIWQQPAQPSGGFGVEVHDYEWACYIGAFLRRCDHADFSAYTFSGIDLSPGEAAYDQGVVYRRVDRVSGAVGSGSSEIDTVYPRLVVTSMQEYPVMNQVVDKV